MPDMAPRDSRANILYADEQAALSWRGAWRILVKSWPFVSRYRRLVALKCALVFVSLTFFLMTPWPLKIIIDNVIDGLVMTFVDISDRKRHERERAAARAATFG